MALSAELTEPLLDTWMEPPNLGPAVCTGSSRQGMEEGGGRRSRSMAPDTHRTTAAMMEGLEVREGMEEAARGEADEVTGRAAAAAEDEVLVARLKTSSGERDSW